MPDVNAREHHGCAVDLSVAETLAALEAPEAVIAVRPMMCGEYPQIERSLCIVFRGEWHEVCRTDLFDDVCTGKHRDKDGPEEALKRARKRVFLGARLKRVPHLPLPLFAIVDALSDG